MAPTNIKFPKQELEKIKTLTKKGMEDVRVIKKNFIKFHKCR